MYYLDNFLKNNNFKRKVKPIFCVYTTDIKTHHNLSDKNIHVDNGMCSIKGSEEKKYMTKLSSSEMWACTSLFLLHKITLV